MKSGERIDDVCYRHWRAILYFLIGLGQLGLGLSNLHQARDLAAVVVRHEVFEKTARHAATAGWTNLAFAVAFWVLAVIAFFKSRQAAATSPEEDKFTSGVTGNADPL
jgi:hypothetical protein